MNMNTIPEGYVLHMPALKHTFESPVWVPAARSASGYPQTERTCKVCGAVKVTLHPKGGGGRAWRRSADAVQVETFDAPACVPVGAGSKT
jgi:cytochrome c5